MSSSVFQQKSWPEATWKTQDPGNRSPAQAIIVGLRSVPGGLGGTFCIPHTGQITFISFNQTHSSRTPISPTHLGHVFLSHQGVGFLLGWSWLGGAPEAKEKFVSSPFLN